MQNESIASKIVSASTDAVGAPTVSIDYASLDAAIAAATVAGTSGECVVQVIDLDLKAGQLRPYRQILEAYIDGAGDFHETVYIVLPGQSGGAVCLHKAFDAVWTAGDEEASNSGLAGHDYAATVVVTSTGLLEAITGAAERAIDGELAAQVVIEDCGPSVRLIRAGYLPGSGAADGGALGATSWR